MKLLVTTLFLFPVSLFAQSPTPIPVNPDDANSLLDALSGQIGGGSKVGIVSAVVLLLVFLFRKYVQPKIGVGNAVLPFLAIGLGALAGVATNILGGATPEEAASIILVSGPGAMAFWASIIKLFTKKT